MAALLAGLPESRAGRDGEPAVRVRALRRSSARPRRDRRRGRRVRRRRRRDDDARAARAAQAGRAASRAATARCTTRRSAGASSTRARRAALARGDGRDRRERRRALGRLPRGAGRVRARSQQRWAAAQAAGRFADEIVPRGRPRARRAPPRPTRRARQAGSLKPAFRAGGTVTAGNASGINDGAARAPDRERGARPGMGVEPLARFVGSARGGRRSGGDGHRARSRPSARRSTRAGLHVGEIDLVELNEAFAAQAIACIRELGLDAGQRERQRRRDRARAPARDDGARLVDDARPRAPPPRRRYGSRRCASASARGRPRSSSARAPHDARTGRDRRPDARPAPPRPEDRLTSRSSPARAWAAPSPRGPGLSGLSRS